MKLVRAALEQGSWAVIQNCHLGLAFMQELDMWLSDVHWHYHKTSRLWLTTEEHPQFPLGMLQRCIKVTNELPKGIKAGVDKELGLLVNQDFIEKVDHPSWKKITFALTLMHAVIVERKKYGSLGWCLVYSFSMADLEASLSSVEKYINLALESKQPVPMKAIRYMVS